MSDAPKVEEKYIVPATRKRPVDFVTAMWLYILMGLGFTLTIHFILLSSEAYNWLDR